MKGLMFLVGYTYQDFLKYEKFLKNQKLKEMYVDSGPISKAEKDDLSKFLQDLIRLDEKFYADVTEEQANRHKPALYYDTSGYEDDAELMVMEDSETYEYKVKGSDVKNNSKPLNRL